MKFFKKKLWIPLTAVFAVLMVVLIVGTVVANSFASQINGFFGLEGSKVVGEAGEDYFKSDFASRDDFDKFQQEVIEEVQAEGSVLLKNEQVGKVSALPLAKGARISLFSHSSVDIIYGGTGSGSVDTSTAPDMRSALEGAGLVVNPTLWDFYKSGAGSKYVRKVTDIDGSGVKGNYEINEVPWSAHSSVANSYSQYGDAAIFVLSRSGGEGGDLPRNTASRGTDEGNGGDYLALSDEEKSILSGLKQLKDAGTFKEIVVLINSSNAPHCDFLFNEAYGIDACLWIGGPGQFGLNSVGKILAGEVNPSGRLVDTFAKDNFTAPSMMNFGDYSFKNAAQFGLTETEDKNQNNTYYVVYQEGIYVGYKYYETRYEDVVMSTPGVGTFNYDEAVAYPFGYGLSYTTFEYSDFSVTPSEDGKTFAVSVTVTNTGNVAGKDVVQIYLQKPYTDYDIKWGVEKPSVELVGFDKTDLLAPAGEEGSGQTVTITVDREQFKSYDANNAGTYIVDDGTYYLAFGTDAHNAVNNILSAKNYTEEDGMTAPGDSAFVYSTEVDSFDDTTYSTAKTGAQVVNRFNDADPSKCDEYDVEVTYLSRNKWEETFPKAAVEFTANEALATDIRDEFVSRKTDEEGNAYTMPIYGADNGLSMIQLMGKSYDDEMWDDLLDQMSFAEQVTLITNSFHQTAGIESINKPGTKETNGPQGITDSFINGRSSGFALPAEVVMCATWSTDVMEQVGECIGEQGLISKTRGVYGPAANIHRTAYAGRNYEYYSEDGFISGEMAAAEVAAIQKNGVYVFMKHYALNDQETHRAGITTWSNEQAIREIYLKPFEIATVDGGAKGYMTVMNRVGAKWGGAHHGLLTDVPRGEWGFDGVIITDCTVNSTYTDSLVGLAAGSDFWDGTAAIEKTDDNLRANSSDPYVCQLMRQAVHRLLYVQVNSSAMNGVSENSNIVNIMNWWQILLICLTVLFAVLAVGSAVMLVLTIRKGGPAAKDGAPDIKQIK